MSTPKKKSSKMISGLASQSSPRGRRSTSEWQELIKDRAITGRRTLSRIVALRGILGRPPDILIMQAVQISNAIEEHQKIDPSFPSVEPKKEYTIRQRAAISTFKNLTPRNRERVFRALVSTDDTDNTIVELFEKFKKNLYDEGVKDELFQPLVKGDFNEKRAVAKSKPRWAEDARPTVQLPMRLSNQLLDRIDQSATESNMNRTEWIVAHVGSYLAKYGHGKPPEFPEFKAKRSCHVRIDPDLNEKITEAAKESGLSKTEWIRRVSHMALRDDFHPTPPEAHI